MTRFPNRLAAIAVLVALIGGCEAPQPLGPAGSVADFISRVSTADGSVQAVLREGTPPVASAAAAPTVPAAGTAVNGGSAKFPVEAGADFTTVYVWLLGADDYWELTLPAGVAASEVVVGVASQVGASTLRLQYGVGTGGTVSQYAGQSLRVYRVGNGDVQVSVSWTGASDVDLHVYDPSGEKVYFGNLSSASGGTLDLDSNAACNLDNVNNENIVWPVGAAPHGEYRVVVNYWDDCGVPRSDYVVTVQAAGLEPQVFSGSFIGPAGGPDAEITTFTY
jgi:uncharacterized protein YfaP (DUF2135 family)